MGVEGYNKEKLDRLKEHKILFDKEAMWRDMQKKKKRRGAFFFFTMALVALAIVFFVWNRCAWQNDSMDSMPDQTLSENLSASPESKNFQLQDEEDITKTTTSGKEESSLESSDIDSANNIDLDDLYTKPIDRNYKETPSSKTYQNVKTSGIDKFLRDSKNEVQNSGQILNTSAKSVENDQLSPPSIIETNNSKNEADLNKNSDDESKTSGKSSKKNLDNTINLQKLPNAFPFLNWNSEKINLDNLIVKEYKMIEVLAPKRSRWALGVYGGYGLPNRTTSSISEPSISDFYRDETLEELSSGLELKYQIKPHIYVRGGLEYWHVTDRRTTISSELINLSEIENSLVGLEEEQVGVILRSQIETKHTIYQTLNAPILIGYNTNRKNLNFFGEVGVAVNIFNFSRGSYYPEERKINKKFQISPQVGLGASYRISSRFDLFARANWRGAQYTTDRFERGTDERKFSATRLQVGMHIGI